VAYAGLRATRGGNVRAACAAGECVSHAGRLPRTLKLLAPGSFGQQQQPVPPITTSGIVPPGRDIRLISLIVENEIGPATRSSPGRRHPHISVGRFASSVWLVPRSSSVPA
jgi:hypothetical protein